MKRPGRRAGAWKDRFKDRRGRRPYKVSPPPPSTRALGPGELARAHELARLGLHLRVIEGGLP